MMNQITKHTFVVAATIAMGLTVGSASSQAATIFLTNDTSPKTLAPNEGDGAPLEGAGAGDTRTLTLSADDGAGTIDMTFIRVQSDIAGNSGNTSIGMDADSMGISNDKWGDPSQGMEFSFDQTIDFLGMTFISGGTAITP